MSEGFELELLKRVVPNFKVNDKLVVPIGDDCAAVDFGNSDKLLLLASDQLIGNIHYFEDKTSPKLAGAKLLKRNLSDIASMGGKPLYAILNIANGNFDIDYLEEFMLGVNEVAESFNTLIIGGDIGHFAVDNNSEMSHLVSSLTIVGEVKKEEICLRKNAKDGDYIFVTGLLGDSLDSEHHLNFTPRLQEGEFLATQGLSDCMIDISDGLLLDLKRVCEASNKSAKINLDNLPLRNKNMDYKQISVGEDYELLFAVKSENIDRLLEMWPKSYAPITNIGIFCASEKIEILDINSKIISISRMGYEH